MEYTHVKFHTEGQTQDGNHVSVDIILPLDVVMLIHHINTNEYVVQNKLHQNSGWAVSKQTYDYVASLLKIASSIKEA